MAFLITGTLGVLLLAPQTLADVYFCQTEAVCTCNDAQGCHALDQYLSKYPKETCRDEDQQIQSTEIRRGIVVHGEKLKVAFKAARPYFGDFDWYQSASTPERGLINLSFVHETSQTNFIIKQMITGSVNHSVWTMSGHCEAIN